jgi:hypothetical protein
MKLADKIIDHFSLSANKTAMALGIKPYQAERLLFRYAEAIGNVLAGHVANRTKLTGGLAVPWDRLREDVGQVRIGRERVWALALMQKVYPLLIPIEKGSNITGEITTAILKHPKQWKEIMADIKQQSTKIVLSQLQDELEDGQFILETPVCVGALDKSFRLAQKRNAVLKQYLDVYKTEEAIYNAPEAVRKDYFDTRDYAWTDEELNLAEIMLDVVIDYNTPYVYRDGFFMLPQVFEQGTNTPRIWGKGVNLQSASKKLRYCAMRHCHQYDINSAAFALLYELACVIDETTDAPYVLSYLDNKEQVRHELTEYVFGSYSPYNEKKVKKAMTAIGFGAKTLDHFNSAYATALDEMFNDQQLKERFLSNDFLVEFIKEWKEIKKTINKWARTQLKEGSFELYEGTPFNYRQRISTAKLLSYIYQCLERKALDLAVEFAELNGAKVTLLLHDGFTTDVELDTVTLNLLVQNQFGEKVSFEYDKIKNIDTVPFVDVVHKKFIKEEEQAAANYHSNWSEVDIELAPRPETLLEELFKGEQHGKFRKD